MQRLGFPDTKGAPWIDYIVADPVLIRLGGGVITWISVTSAAEPARAEPYQHTALGKMSG